MERDQYVIVHLDGCAICDNPSSVSDIGVASLDRQDEHVHSTRKQKEWGNNITIGLAVDVK